MPKVAKGGVLTPQPQAKTVEAGRSQQSQSKEPTVPSALFIKHLDKELHEEDSCKRLPLAAILVFAFISVLSLTVRNWEAFEIEQAFIFDIEENANFAFSSFMGHKDLHDVNNIADFWSWMRLGLVPLLVQPKHVFSEGNLRTGLPPVFSYGPNAPLPAERGYLMHSELIGGLRMTQVLSEQSTCRVQSALPWFCFARKYAPRPFASDFFPVAEDDRHGEKEEWLSIDSPVPDLEVQLLDMEDGCLSANNEGRNCLCSVCRSGQPWLDPRAEKVQVSFLVTHRSSGLWSLVTVGFVFTAAGRIWKKVDVRSQWAYPYQDLEGNLNGGLIVAQIVWLGLIVEVVVYLVLGLRRVTGKLVMKPAEQLPSEKDHPLQSRSSVAAEALSNLVMGSPNKVARKWIDGAVLVTAGGQTLQWAVLVGSIGRVSDAYAAGEPPRAIFRAMEDTLGTDRWMMYWNALHIVVLFARVLHVMSGQPRLAIVSNTFSKSIVDIIHFCVVFLMITILFGALGYVLFGRDVDQFSSPGESLWGCMSLLFGELEWSVLVEARGGRFQGIAFVLAFTMLVSLVLINMLLAVIIDTYCEVKAELAGGGGAGPETLWSQSAEIYDRWRGRVRGERLGLSDVRDSVRALLEQGQDEISVSLLEREVFVTKKNGEKQYISESQAKRLFGVVRGIASAGKADDHSEQCAESLLHHLHGGAHVSDSNQELRPDISSLEAQVAELTTALHEDRERLMRMESLLEQLASFPSPSAREAAPTQRQAHNSPRAVARRRELQHRPLHAHTNPPRSVTTGAFCSNC
mmetsp:Transcript_12829/g.30724  ORF Transcript_12829/g.30724 Transcript_12829/m.30724 type:complete len:798 (-) Transcript_12829:128-2521(-)